MKKTILILGFAGTLFAGYMSSVKLFSQTCAFNEPCPYFFGFPACYIGLALFLLITIFAALLVWGKMRETRALNAIVLVSFLGVLYAAYFTYGELPVLIKEGFSAFALGLPTCALGLIFYILVFAFSLSARLPRKAAESN